MGAIKSGITRRPIASAQSISIRIHFELNACGLRTASTESASSIASRISSLSRSPGARSR